MYAVEPFNTTGEQGLILEHGSSNSSNIYRVTGATTSQKHVPKSNSSRSERKWRATSKSAMRPFPSPNVGPPHAGETLPGRR